VAASVEQNRTRVSILAELIRKDGPSTGTLLKYCLQEWGVRERGAYTLIRRARAAIAADFDDVERREMSAIQIHRLETVYEKAVRDGCWSSALGAINSINSMLGIGFAAK